MNTRPIPRTLAWLLAALALVASGCTGPADSASSEPSESEADDTHDHPSSTHVDILELSFSPEEMTIAAGTALSWTNHDRYMHTVTPTDPTLWGTEGSPEMEEGDSWVHTFEAPGTYDYYCIPHAWQDKETGEWTGMTARVVVT